MSRWLNLKIFALALLLMTVQQTQKIQSAEITAEIFFQAMVVVLIGGFFWGIIGTFIYNHFYTKK